MTEKIKSGASKYVRDHGLPSVVYVAKRADISRELLHKWFHTRPLAFRLLVIGCAFDDEVLKDKQNDQTYSLK